MSIKSTKNDFLNERKIIPVKAEVMYAQQIQFLRYFNRLPLAILCVTDEFESLVMLYVNTGIYILINLYHYSEH